MGITSVNTCNSPLQNDTGQEYTCELYDGVLERVRGDPKARRDSLGEWKNVGVSTVQERWYKLPKLLLHQVELT